MDSLGEMKVKIGADTAGLEAAVEKIKAPLAKIGSQFESWGKKAAIAGAAVGAAMIAIAKTTANAGDEINDLSKRTGISTELLSSYKLAAEKAGSSLGGFATAMRGLSARMLDAQTGSAEAKRAFDALGVSVTDSNGKLRPLNEVLLDVANRFSRMEDGAGKAALAQDIFGRSGMELIPLLNQGAAGLKEEAEMAKTLGVVFSTEAAANADEFNDAMRDLRAVLEGMRNDIGNALIPVFTRLAEAATEGLATIRSKIDELAKSGKLQEWAEAMARGVVTAFKVMAKAVEGLLLTVQFVQGVVFKLGEELMRMFAEWGARLFTMVDLMAKVVPGMSGIRKQIADIVASMVTIGMEYDRLADQKFEAATDIVVGFEELYSILDKLKASFRAAKGASDGLAGSLQGRVAPAAGAAQAAAGKLGKTLALDVMPKAQGLAAVMDQIPGIIGGTDWNALPKAAEPAIEQTRSYFQELCDSIESGFSNTIARSLDEAWGFSHFLKEVWGNIKASFFAVIGDMIAKWAVGLIRPLVSTATAASASITTSFGTAISGLAAGLVSVVKAVASALPIIAQGIAAAATTIAAAAPAIAVAAALALAIAAGFKVLGSIFDKSKSGAGDGMGRVVERQDQQTSLLTQIMDLTRNGVVAQLEDIKTTCWSMIDRLRDTLAGVKTLHLDMAGITKVLENLKGAAGGAVSTRPQLMMIHGTPAKPEYVLPAPNLQALVTTSPPTGAGAARPVSLSFYINTLDADSFERVLKDKIVPGLQRTLDHRGLRVPVGAVGG